MADECAIVGTSWVEGCRDDSGPNLLVRGVEFLVVVAVATVIVASVRRLRRRPRRSGDDEPG
jgi:hypothetical protein